MKSSDSLHASRSRNQWVISHCACQLPSRSTNVKHKSRRRSVVRATLCFGVEFLFCPVLSCPVLPYILPPLPWFGTSTSERNWMNLNRRFVRALILIDMLSRDEFCSSARLPWVAAHLPLPHPFMWLQQRFSTCGLGPHSGRRAARVPAGTPNSHFTVSLIRTSPRYITLVTEEQWCCNHRSHWLLRVSTKYSYIIAPDEWLPSSTMPNASSIKLIKWNK